VRAVADAACARPLVGTYQTAFRALALQRSNRDGEKVRLDECLQFLLRSQLANGQWTYSPPSAGTPAPPLGDNSNTAYAILALAACRRRGSSVPDEAIARAAGWWVESQASDGGWGYRTDRETASYASMTESGLSSLLFCHEFLDKARKPAIDDAITRATSWVASNYAVEENRQSGYQQGRILYHLFALERCGALLGRTLIGGHDWFQDGASYLTSTQAEDGSWDDGADTPIPGTCFALFFLARATEP
jgi:Squalene-hopene cyclase C-terminal domain